MAQILCQFNIDIKRCVFTTDRGGNIVNAFKNDIRLDCAAHILNTVVTNIRLRHSQAIGKLQSTRQVREYIGPSRSTAKNIKTIM